LSESAGALDGVRVISFGAFVAGNIAAKLLAELGADVVKIEPRSRPEVLRAAGHAIGSPATEPSGAPNAVTHAGLSRGVRSLSLDLESSAARPVFHRLVAAADLVVENFAGTTLPRWGCAFDDLVRDNPRLVLLSLSGYGRTGPGAGYRAYGTTIAAHMGLSHAWRYSHGTATDYLAAVHGVVAAVAAIGRARATGEPVHVDVGQIDAAASTFAGLYLAPLNLGHEDPSDVNTVPGSWLAGLFPGLGHEAWVVVDVEDGADWSALCALLERADLAATTADDAALHELELRQALADWISGHTPFTAMHFLQRAGLAAGVVQTSEDLWRDPQLRVRDFAEPVAQADLGVVTYPASAQRWTGTPGGVRLAPARLGEHTGGVLREWIGLTDGELAELAERGAIYDAGERNEENSAEADGLPAS
jgi:crotonobetainyl-CoA:carnitine CoA-transferase CaiB-like acyl-CoA transferase